MKNFLVGSFHLFFWRTTLTADLLSIIPDKTIQEDEQADSFFSANLQDIKVR